MYDKSNVSSPHAFECSEKICQIVKPFVFLQQNYVQQQFSLILSLRWNDYSEYDKDEIYLCGQRGRKPQELYFVFTIIKSNS